MSHKISEADDLLAILARALKRCDESSRFFCGYHTPKPAYPKPDKRVMWAAFWNNPDDDRHGTVNGYINLRCRCDRCRAARPKQSTRPPKETPVSAVSDLFDPIPNEPPVEHGTVEGAKVCRFVRGLPPGELCFSCANAVRAENRPHSASSSARGTTRAAETAKALEAHRLARKKLQADLAAERSA